ncbi:hypothetical protein L7F22_010081 [Adiantum nelumboides]|nr:hypothetical protein [Adiantum nelumboides]
MKEPEFRKICLKLTNGVRWGSAVHLERTCTDETCKRTPRCKGAPFYRECRFFDRKPHWEVHQRSKEYMDTLPEDKKGDSFLGWRTEHIHFSISIYSPKNNLRPHSKEEPETKDSSDSVNNLYFTPLAWEHFWAWMRLFNSALSLPIRQGKLFPGSLAQSPKFGRHLATIKYRFDISPLFISHLYPQQDKSDWANGMTSLLGIKTRTSVFHFDLHQRQQETVRERPELGESRKVFHKPFYEAEIDLGEIDFRTLAGQFREPEKQLFPHDEGDAGDETQDIFAGECEINERDAEWIDLNDFVELDWRPPQNRPPRIKLIQALTCPRFNYYRRIESKRERSARTTSHSKDVEESGKKGSQTGGASGEEGHDEALSRLEQTKFGSEPTHTCLVGKAPRAHMIQRELACSRLDFLKEELSKLESTDGEPVSMDYTGVEAYNTEQAAATEGMEARIKDLRKKVKLIAEYIQMVSRLDKLEQRDGTSDTVGKPSSGALPDYVPQGGQVMDADVEPRLAQMYQAWESFDNRFFAHNPAIFYSNSTRDILLKYYLSSRRRRGVVHHLTAKAVRYIRELSKSDDGEDEKDDSDKSGGEKKQDASTDEKSKGRRPASRRRKSSKRHARHDSSGSPAPTTANGDPSRDSNGSDLLRGLLNDTMQYIMDEPEEINGQQDRSKVIDENVDPTLGISEAFDVRKSNVCVFLKPQIVLRSLVNDRSTVVLTAIRTRLHNYAVKDPEVEEDSVNERALYRNYLALDGLQAFSPSKHCSFLDRARQRYGFLHVPLETLIDLKDFDRIAPRTDATLHYDKFNKLRLHDPSRPVAADLETQDPAIDHLRHHMDLIRVRCPRYSVLANSEHFASIYNVVTDLLLYRDPAYREHAKRLETMMLSYDMTDHAVLAEVVSALQVRIRHARELHLQYQLHFDHLNEQGRMDFLSLKAELKDMIDELTLIMEGITAADDNNSGSDKEKKSALRIEAQAQDIAWNMMGDKEGELLAKLSIKGASFTWLNKADNSAANTLSIADLNAVNVHPDAVFTEIITKYNNVDHPWPRREGCLTPCGLFWLLSVESPSSTTSS